jgi:hypothetical protein
MNSNVFDDKKLSNHRFNRIFSLNFHKAPQVGQKSPDLMVTKLAVTLTNLEVPVYHSYVEAI